MKMASRPDRCQQVYGSNMAEVNGDGVSILTEVCDDAVSIVTNTTRNSDENGDLIAPYTSLLGLKMLDKNVVLQTDVTDRTLSPVLPVHTSTWSRRDTDLSAAEDSDHDSVMSESLLRHTEQTQHNDDPKSVPEDQASQLLFDDTQSSGDQSEILPIQSVQPDYQEPTVSPMNHLSPNLFAQSPGLSHSNGTRRIDSEERKNCSGKTKSPQGKMCRLYSTQCSEDVYSRSTPSSGENRKSAVNPRSTPSSEELGRYSVKTFLRSNDSQETNVSRTSSDDQTKRTGSSQSLRNNDTSARKLSPGQEQAMLEESPWKCRRVDSPVDLDDKQENLKSTPQKGYASQSTISPRESSPVVAEHDREEAIFKKIIKQQDYVDKQLCKSHLLRDVEKIKQHMDTLQSLLRQLSNQHKCHRQRLTAIVRSTSKTKQDRVRHKREIEQLGKRQKQLIQLVQRQKTLTCRLKDLEHKNDDQGYTTSATGLSQNLNQASQNTGSSQVVVTPPVSKEQRVQDTQSSRSSCITTESFSQSLLLSSTSNIPVKKSTEQMSMASKAFTNRSLIGNGSEVPRHGGPGTVSANSSFKSSISQQKSSLVLKSPREKTFSTSPINQPDPQESSTRAKNRSSPESCTHVETRSSAAQPSGLVGECSTIQSCIRIEERPAPVQTDRPMPVSNSGGTCSIPTMIRAGLETQHFHSSRTLKNVLPNLTSKETISRVVINPNVRILFAKTNAPYQSIGQTPAKVKPIFVPPPIVKPRPNTSVITLSSPPQLQHQKTYHGPIFKSPPIQNVTAVDNISPSTASCSDVFPVKSSEIHRRIQQRRLIAESQKEEEECEVPIPVLQTPSVPYTEHTQEDQRKTTDELRPFYDATLEHSEQPSSTAVQTKYPPLRTLIDRGALVPGKDCLATESKYGRYVGSLLESGLIRGPGGEVFKTPVQWVSAVNDGVLVKKRRAYREVFYHGQPLLTFVDPDPTSIIDLTKTNVEPVNNRAYDGLMSSDAFPKKQAPFDLETLLKNCTVRLIFDDEIVPSSDLPENFWKDDFSNVRLPMSIQEQIDCW